MKLDPYLTLYGKINLKLIKDLSIRGKTIKFLEDNVGGKLHDIGFSNDFLDMTLKAQAKKEKKKYINWTTPKFKSLLIKGYNPLNEKEIHRRENICKLYIV